MPPSARSGGVSLDAATGEITGIPTSSQDPAVEHVVSATNDAGEAKAEQTASTPGSRRLPVRVDVTWVAPLHHAEAAEFEARRFPNKKSSPHSKSDMACGHLV